MTMTFRIAASAIFLILSFFPGLAQSLPSSTAAQGFHSKVRLLSGGKQGEIWLAGLEITLDQGFKTYWRNPGESGLPPSFDWSRSENVEHVEVRWPAPKRHEDAAGVAYVYGSKVVLPLMVKAVAAGKPVKLALTIDYGICKDICIPARADLDLPLMESAVGRRAIEEAMGKVPRFQELGAQADLSISEISLSNKMASFVVRVRAPAGSNPSLFAEGPDNWYFSTSGPRPVGDHLPDTHSFLVTVEEGPKGAVAPVPLRLTLVAGDSAIETQVSLDASGLPR